MRSLRSTPSLHWRAQKTKANWTNYRWEIIVTYLRFLQSRWSLLLAETTSTLGTKEGSSLTIPQLKAVRRACRKLLCTAGSSHRNSHLCMRREISTSQPSSPSMTQNPLRTPSLSQVKTKTQRFFRSNWSSTLRSMARAKASPAPEMSTMIMLRQLPINLSWSHCQSFPSLWTPLTSWVPTKGVT